MQFVLNGDVSVAPFHKHNNEPKSSWWKRSYTGNKPDKDLLTVPEDVIEQILMENERHTQLELITIDFDKEDQKKVKAQNKGTKENQEVEGLIDGEMSDGDDSGDDSDSEEE